MGRAVVGPQTRTVFNEDRVLHVARPKERRTGDRAFEIGDPMTIVNEQVHFSVALGALRGRWQA